jgi:hypothetical protein
MPGAVQALTAAALFFASWHTLSRYSDIWWAALWDAGAFLVRLLKRLVLWFITTALSYVVIFGISAYVSYLFYHSVTMEQQLDVISNWVLDKGKETALLVAIKYKNDIVMWIFNMTDALTVFTNNNTL